MIYNSFLLDFLQRNIVVSTVIIAVLLVRLVLRKCPRKYSYYLWAVVGFRMMFDFKLSSVVSLFNVFKLFSNDTKADSTPVVENIVRPTIQNVAGITIKNNQNIPQQVVAINNNDVLEY